jgi:hypothetical protein
MTKIKKAIYGVFDGRKFSKTMLPIRQKHNVFTDIGSIKTMQNETCDHG